MDDKERQALLDTYKAEWLRHPYTKQFQQKLEQDRIRILEMCESLSISSPIKTEEILQKLAQSYQLRQIIKQIN